MCCTNLGINQQSFLIHEKDVTSVLLLHAGVSLSFHVGHSLSGEITWTKRIISRRSSFKLLRGECYTQIET
jgi:hypothetical protein